MAYQVLARKWRPQRFGEVVGQEHITRTLQNAILQNRVGHAYLFVGPRGIGKTTTARIFAKALNCAQGMTGEPCCQCTPCQEIAQGSCLDVIEIDGASHNKVEHIRDLRDNVQYTPARCRFKVYIIDEVHMLTPAAWNALLKTLEEPPPHVKFIFATTEAHKVLATIVSRCQRFDLKAIPVPLIVARLRQIASEEGLHVDDGALGAIARAADGGMRDAQSIFDQIIAFCGGLSEAERIREQDVIEVFGLASGAELRALAEGLLRNDLNAAIEVVQGLSDRGRDLERLYADLLAYVRNLMVCTVCREPGRILEATDVEVQEVQAVAQGADAGLIQRLLQGLVGEEWAFRSALNKRLYLEATLARVAMEAHSVQLNDIIAQLLAVQAGGQVPVIPSPTRPAPPAPPLARPAAQPPATVPAVAAASTQTAPVQAHALPPAAPEARPPAAPAGAPPAAAPAVAPAAPAPAAPAVAAPADAAAAAPVAAPAAAAGTGHDSGLRQDRDGYPAAVATPALPGDPSGAPLTDGPADGPAEDAPYAVEPAPELQVADAPPQAPPPAAPVWPEPARLFEALLAELGREARGVALLPLAKRLQPVSVIGNVFQVAYDADGLLPQEVRSLQAPETQAVLRACFARVAPVPEGTLVLKRWIASVSDEQRAARRRGTPEDRQRIAGLPFVRDVCAAVGGQVVDVRVSGSEPRRAGA